MSNTYKIKTTTGYTEYISTSDNPFNIIVNKVGFDFDQYNSHCLNSVKYGSGIINYIELYYCSKIDKKLKEVLYANK